MFASVLVGYAIGSVPFAFLIARGRGIDIRAAGSGNVGAANVLRTTSASLGLAVMTLDILKGATTVLVAQAGSGTLASMAAAGGAAIVGHIYPVWLRFRGGKGVAVAAGVFAVLAPIAALAAAATFLATVWTTRIVSLASIAATLLLPSIAWLSGAPRVVVAAAAGAAALIVFRHRSNLRRILEGTERRVGERE